MKQKEAGFHSIGVDVSKRTFDAALARRGQRFPSTPLRDLPWKTFARTEEGAKECLKWFAASTAKEGEAQVRIVMEATGNYSIELAAWLTGHDPNIILAIENPARTKAFIDSLGQRNKTDGLDARGLAFYGAERRPVPYEPLTPEREELRSLTRHRDTRVKERTALKNRIQECCTSRTVRTMRTRQLRQLDRDIAKLETEMNRVIHKASSLREDFNLLLSIVGVGPITAAVVLAELGDLRRFERARQLSAFVGVSPRVYESGTSVRGRTRMCKRGNGRVRQALFLSAMATLRTKAPNTLKDTHRRLCMEGKAGKSALGAVMRKQLILMRAVVVSGKPYDPLWKTQPRAEAKPGN